MLLGCESGSDVNLNVAVVLGSITTACAAEQNRPAVTATAASEVFMIALTPDDGQ